MREFLESSHYIDWKSATISHKAAQLSAHQASEEGIVKACFEFVRDDIKHSFDYQLNPVTCKASHVLREGTGFCFAKSHLLAALLRANHIPAALCYQRIAFGARSERFYLHGLNSVFLKNHGWYRLDPRGLKAGLVSEFHPPQEALPFLPALEGELIYEKHWSEPDAKITSLLESCKSYSEVIEFLPSINL